MDEKTRDEQKDQNQYDEPSLLDIEDLEEVAGTGCATGGCWVVEQ